MSGSVGLISKGFILVSMLSYLISALTLLLTGKTHEKYGRCLG
jgi:hypothetical protein